MMLYYGRLPEHVGPTIRGIFIYLSTPLFTRLKSWQSTNYTGHVEFSAFPLCQRWHNITLSERVRSLNTFRPMFTRCGKPQKKVGLRPSKDNLDKTKVTFKEMEGLRNENF